MRNAGPIRILVVDGSRPALQVTAQVLRLAGYEVIEAATGEAALAAASRSDLVVLDVNLPDMSGLDVRRRLRAAPDTERLPVLQLSPTFVESAGFAQGFEAGADSFLTTPVEAPVLIAAVRTLLFARRADMIKRELDAKMRTVFNLAPMALAMLDDDFNYENVNVAYCELTGYGAAELVGTSAERYLAPGTGPVEAAAGAVVPTVERWTRQVQFVKKDGSLATLEWQISQDASSGIRILVAADITQNLRAEEARESLLASERAARAEAERSNRLKEEFLATLSHELRNPLNAILGWATVLSRKPDLPDAVKNGLQAIERNSRIQAQMIADLLDYAGITFGKIRLVAEHIDPYPAIRAALDVVSGAAQAAGVRIRSVFDDEKLLIEADESRVQQIVWNLLSNAVKFSTRGDEVLLEAGRSGECLNLVVTDHGRGIEPDYLPRIFERFSQQDATTTRSHGGLGLGLAIVKQLAEWHGGTIHAFSAGKGTGATLTVKIPLSRDEAAPRSSDSQLQRSLDFSQVVALVVEDDDDARALTKRILLDVGATVVEASSAEEALSLVNTAKPNMLISDIGMARQDGYQLMRTLRAAGHGADALPAIALTAFARNEDRSEALSAGFQEHLIKPLEPQALLARIAFLRMSGQARSS